MPAERLSMRKVREVLRLRHTLGMSFRQISEATGIGKTVVGEYVRRAGVLGMTWPVPEAIDDAELERRLFPIPCETGPPRAAIDWRKIHEEMKRRSVTLVLLWQEYRAEQLARVFTDRGVTYDYAGEERAMPTDLIPRVIDAAEWDLVSKGGPPAGPGA